MSGNNANKINHCLNRLIMTEMKDPDKLNPYSVLQEICDFEKLQEMKKLFRKCCQASLSEKYIWDEGIPGNLLYIYEQFEKLVESCYLIYRKKGFKKKVSKKTKEYAWDKSADHPELPSSLSSEEFMNPRIVINDFFEEYSLLEWKIFIHSWMEAGLSNFSVLENIKSKELLPYVYGMEKLLEASYRIVDLSAGKN
jgi:hypothetical protein